MQFKNSKRVLQEIKNQSINTEFEQIDYKIQYHFDDKKDKLELIKDIVSFANTNGGCIIYGVKDKTYEWVGVDDNSNEINDIQINDFMKQYVNEKIDFQVGQYEIDGEDFYFITIDKHNGNLIQFTKDGIYERTRRGNRKTQEFVFKKNDEYGRIGSSNRIVNHDKIFKKIRNNNSDIVSNLSSFPRPYKDYIDRPKEFDVLLESLNNENIRNVQINGLGGIGKTSFIRNFCDSIVVKPDLLDINISFLVWITGKMTYFTPYGDIEVLRTSELTFTEMADEICNLFMIETFDKNDEDIEKDIINALRNYNSLLVFDNMETISDRKILNFVKKIPNNCRVVFTTRTNLTTVYERIDLDGFDVNQFREYFKKQLENYDKKESVNMSDIEYYLKDLHELIHGSPIIANMIVYKISTGFNLSNLLGELRKMKKGVNYYDSVMNFCFEDVFNDLTNLEKQILFIMSISDNEEFFQISDLKYILESDDIDVSDAVSKLFRVSFCYRIGDQYSSTSLVKMFSNKKMSKDKNIQITKITDKYYDWLKKKTELGVIENDLYVRAKAYNFERKSLVSEIRNILLDYDIYQNYDDTIAKIDKVILKDPTYAYLYFKKANFEKNSNKDKRIVIDAMEKAILNEPNHDYYLSEFAFYYSEIKENQKAIELFKKSLVINDKNPSTHHGVAVCYTKFYNNKSDYYDKADIIIDHFQKGYFEENNRYANSHNARNAHAHARYLLSIKKYEEAKLVAKKGFDYAPNNGPLKTLYSEIQTAINPNYVSTSKVNDIRKGIFTNVSDDILREVVKMTSKKK